MNYKSFMLRALELAKKSAEADEVPVGAVIFDSDGRVISEAHNLTENANDPTAHAEILAIRNAALSIGQARLEGLSMAVTLEPCTMCAAAISNARIKTLIYGAYDVKGGAVDNGVKFYNSAACHHKPEVISGVMEAECGEIMKEFFLDRRQ